MYDFDARFFRSLLQGAFGGAVALWVTLVAVFLGVTDQPFAVVLGFSALPAVFCGPFFGGLYTTTRLHVEDAEPTAEIVPARQPGTGRLAA